MGKKYREIWGEGGGGNIIQSVSVMPVSMLGIHYQNRLISVWLKPFGQMFCWCVENSWFKNVWPKQLFLAIHPDLGEERKKKGFFFYRKRVDVDVDFNYSIICDPIDKYLVFNAQSTAKVISGRLWFLSWQKGHKVSVWSFWVIDTNRKCTQGALCWHKLQSCAKRQS